MTKQPHKTPSRWRQLGPGLVTGAADDDPSGIATYSQAGAPAELHRINIDTYVGVGLSNSIALFIIIATAATLHRAGVLDIQTSAQAAEALRPVAGRFAFVLFSLGIVGTGLLAVPVLAGSAAYAVAETFKWRRGLNRKLREAQGFYGIVALATLGGVALTFSPIDPIKALFWSAVINGVISVPVLIVMMLLTGNKKVMGRFVSSPRSNSSDGWRPRS
jgi:Mn2+/Fe2+ NRAMP family transporter